MRVIIDFNINCVRLEVCGYLIDGQKVNSIEKEGVSYDKPIYKISFFDFLPRSIEDVCLKFVVLKELEDSLTKNNVLLFLGNLHLIFDVGIIAFPFEVDYLGAAFTFD